MGKVLKPVLIGAAIVGLAVVTGGASIVPSLSVTTATGATLTAAGYLSTTALGSVLIGIGASQIAGGLAQAFTKTPKMGASQTSRLTTSIDPRTPRKMVFGRTAMATDIRYYEPSGEDQDYIDYIIAVAAHRVASIEQIWIEDQQAWDWQTGILGKYAGYLTVATVLEGSASNTIAINGGAKWGSNRRLTGCAYVHLRIKRTGNSKKAESPFVGGLSGRITIIGKGMPLYDPRFDSTVPGGSGPMRVDDQSTWAFEYGGRAQGGNLALQALAYKIGWRINGKLSVGRGFPPSRIDLASYMTAANLCDEAATIGAGGTELRYAGAGVYSEDDDPGTVLGTMTAACNGAIRDSGGRLSFHIAHNDLSFPVIDLDDNDVLSGFTWDPHPTVDQRYNVVRGRWTDPSLNSIYQQPDYPEVALPSIDGIDRILTLDLLNVESPSRAQRIAKQVLQRRQFQGTFQAEFAARAWNAQVGDIVRFTFSPLGFVNKLFRVTEQTIQMNGRCPMTLVEEHASIYAWSGDDRPAVVAAPPTIYDPLNAPLLRAVIAMNADRGDYSSLVLYQQGDVVRLPSDGRRYIYIATAPSSGNAPPNPTYWSVFEQAPDPRVQVVSPPPDVSGFQATILGDSCHLQWDAPDVLGLTHYIIKFQGALTGATWANALTLLPKVPGNASGITVPAMNGSYLIKAVNSATSESVNPAIISSNVKSLNAINVVATIAEGTPWSGVLTDVVIDPLGLMMSGGGNMDLWPDIDAVENFDIGNVDNGFVIDGTYDFEDSLDLGAVYTSRLTASLEVAGLDWRSNLDEIPDLDAVSNFDGADPSLWNVELQVQTSNDGTTWGPWRTFLVGDYTARAFRFRARLTSGDPYVTPILQAASVTVDMPDRTIGGNDLAAPSGGLTVSFGNAYRAVPAIAIAAQGLATGDYYAITAKTVGGFQIQFFNSAGTGVARTFDYVAKGYGVEA